MLENILKIAVLGTQKSFFSEEEQETLKQWKIPLDKAPEKVFLESALVYAKMQQAGFQPAVNDSENLPAPPEIFPAIGRKSAFQLGLMLDGANNQVLPEFIQLLQTHQKRVNHFHLPALLDWGGNKPDLQPLLSQVIGERGHWLARQNPTWQYVLGRESTQEIDWETASFVARRAYLQHVRRNDPQKAIQLLEKTWAQEEVNHKTGFLKILARNLQKEDEVFLNTLRRGRRKEVRLLAFDYLSKIPESVFNKEMYAYLDKHLRIKGNFLKKSIDILLPATFNQELKNLGVQEKLTLTKGGQKANWLAQIIVRIHPDYWEEKLQKKPDEIVALIQKSEWNELLISTISKAAIFHQEQRWLSAFFEKTHNRQSLNLNELITTLSEEEFNTLIATQVKSGVEALYHNKPLFLLLEYSQANLYDDNARKIIQLYQELVRKEHRKSSYYQWQTKNLLIKLGQRINPALLSETREGWTENLEHGDHWFANITEFFRLLEFRKEMYDALEED